MMKKIIVIVPYFGQLPSFYYMWEKSVLYNNTINFVLITDDLNVSSKENLQIIHMLFDDYKKRIQDKFLFEINLNKPYKLCDLKPAIGYCFPEIIEGYDFWGYCDLDLTFGDIRKFITNEVLNRYEKIFVTAHFSLYKNEEKMIKLFMDAGDFPEYNYEEAFSDKYSCYFDEFRGMELKCLRNNIEVYSCKETSDYNPSKACFFNRNKQQVILVWDKGNLYEMNKEGVLKELLYAHYQKRKMDVNNLEYDRIYIVPGKISGNFSQNNSLFDFKSGYDKGYTYKFKIKKVRKVILTYGIVGLYKRYKRCAKIEALKKKLTQ